MRLRYLTSSSMELDLNDNLYILFSYETPVACFIQGEGYYYTEKKWSNTTSRHINSWLAGMNAKPKPQEFFDAIIENCYGDKI
jgi:hypothetical protein